MSIPKSANNVAFAAEIGDPESMTPCSWVALRVLAESGTTGLRITDPSGRRGSSRLTCGKVQNVTG